MRRDLPFGTVTFLFSDVGGSTKLLHELGAEEYADALAEHRRILRDAFARHGGVEVDTQGDAFFVAFPTAPGALDAAREALAGLADTPIRVRVGVHTGTPLVTDEGYVGADVHRAARIAAAGHGGQVLVSAATASLTAVDGLRELGEHRLKDLSAPERIYQLGDGEFPPLKSLHQTNLPIPATAFLGRDQELAELAELITRDDARLVTLTGPGGTGKTRLALQAAGAVADAFPAGVWWVPLAPVRDPQLVVETAARTLGVKGDLGAHIGDKRLLLLFDNFEHVVEAAADVAKLLATSPNLRVLVTRREPLHLDGEWGYAVDPLHDHEAVELFETRARAARRDFAPNGEVQAICARLDNFPLAIELAAARVKVLSPQALLERLEQRLPVLAGGTRDMPERQRTLRATIEWSYDLCSAEEQSLFRRLGVFRGGATLEAAEEVCDADLDTLASLVDKSLVRQRDDRFWMLETIHEYASERLEESREEDAVLRRHAEHYLRLAESANLSVDAFGRAPQRHELVLPEQHNMRAAIAWATDAHVELGLRLAVALEQFWIGQDPREGVRIFEALLGRAEGVDPLLYARAVRDYGGCADMADEIQLAERAYARSRELFLEVGDENGIATATSRLGVIAYARGDPELAQRYWLESREMWQRAGDPLGELQVLGFLGSFELDHGDVERGLELTERSLAMGREVGWTRWVMWRLASSAEGLLKAGRLEEAEQRAREALAVARDINDRGATLFSFAALAWAAAQRGDAKRAAVLWPTVQAEEARVPTPRWERYRQRYAAQIPDDVPAAAPLPLDDAVAYALSDE